MKQYSTLDMQGNEIINCPSLGSGGDANLTEEIKSNITVGGAPAGTTFEDNLSFTDFAKRILRTNVNPTIKFTATGSGTKEESTKVNGSTLTLEITNLSTTTESPTSIEFRIGNTVLGTEPYVDGKSVYTYIYDKVITKDTTFQGILTYNETVKLSASATITFIPAKYYGIVDSTPTEAEILSPQFTKLVDKSKAFTWNNIT